MIIHIAVCDDDVNILNFMERYLQEKNKELQEEELSIYLYKSGADFLRDIERGMIFHMAFLDIEMDVDGITVGQTLRGKKEGIDTILIYISRYKTRFEELVDICISGFISKPICKERLNKVFGRGLEKAKRYCNIMAASRIFQYQVRREKRYVDVDKILYLKNTLSWVSIYTCTWDATEKTAYVLDTFYAKMSTLIERLPKNEFIFCERSHIVNMHYVKEIAATHLILKDKEGTQIPISSRRITGTKKAYIDFLKGGTSWKRVSFD